MLKSKLGIKNNNKDKDTNSSNVNNKDSNVHSNKSSLKKKLLNGKTTGHNLLNSIKPIKPKGSLYDISNSEGKNENRQKNDDDVDNTTLASSSPKTLEPLEKDKLDIMTTVKASENKDLNNLNDTPSSPKQHWAPSVASSTSSGKGLANTTFDSMKTLTSSAPTNTTIHSSSPSLTNLNLNTSPSTLKTPKTTASTVKPSSPYLSPPKSPLEAISRFAHFKSSDNIAPASPSSSIAPKRNSNQFLSVPNLSSKDSSNSLQSQVSSQSAQSSENTGIGMSSIAKKFSKKDKKDTNTSSKDGSSKKQEGRKPSSLFSSIGKYFKNKATGQIKDKDKKSKEKLDILVADNSTDNVEGAIDAINGEEEKGELVEVRTREIASLDQEVKNEIKALQHNHPPIQIKTMGEEEIDGEAFDPESLKTPKPKEEEEDDGKEGSSKRISVEFTPKFKTQSIPSVKTVTPMDRHSHRMSSSVQSVTLVENQSIQFNKSEQPSSFSSGTTQSIPIDSSSLKVIDDSIKITSSPSSIPPLSDSAVSNMKETLNLSETEEDTEARDSEMDREGTYRQSYSKNDDTSFLDNEDTIIKKSSIVSSNGGNKRLSARDINFCRELRLAGGLESNRNSLTIESTITADSKAKRMEEEKNADDLTKNLTVSNSGNKLLEVPNSSLAKTLYATVIPETQEEISVVKGKLNKEEIKELSKQSSFEVRDEEEEEDISFEDTSMVDESSILESDHNILASSPRLSIASPYSHSNYSTSAANRSPNQENKRFNLFIPKAPSAIGLVTTPSNSTHNTSISGGLNNISASLDAIPVPMSLVEEPLEEKRCPYCHCITVNDTYRHFESLDNISYEEDKNSINSSSRFSSATKLTMSPKLSPHSIAVDKLDNSSKTTTNTHHYGQYLSSGGPGSIASSVSSSKDYSHSINSSYTFSTVTTTSEEDCDCHCHDARYQHPSFHVYHTKNTSQEPPSSQASVSGMSFNSYQSRYSNISGYTTESMSKIYDKRSFCSATSSFSLANSFFFGSNSNSSKNKNKNIRRKDFSKSTREIGRGATCVVKLVHKVNDPNMLFALKEYKLSRVKQNIDERTFLKHLRNEYQIGSLLHHPNIIETFAFLMTKTHNHKRRKYFVVLEYCEGGDLFNTIQNGNLGRQEINCNFKQLMDGVNYLHSLGVAHCDIKPENILIKNVSQLKIIDFGTSEIFKYPYTPDTIKKSRGVKGSKPYIAPEQFQRSEYDPRASDIWSCAIVYIASLFDELPWRVASLEDFDFLRWKKERRNDLIRHIPDGPRQLITQMLNPDPDKRITMEQIYENEWFASIKTCISGEVQCHDKKHHHIQPNES